MYTERDLPIHIDTLDFTYFWIPEVILLLAVNEDKIRNYVWIRHQSIVNLTVLGNDNIWKNRSHFTISKWLSISYRLWLVWVQISRQELAICLLTLPQFQLKDPHSDDKLKWHDIVTYSRGNVKQLTTYDSCP